MDPKDWTPRAGWRIALTRMVIGAVLLCILGTGAGWVGNLVQDKLPRAWSLNVLALFVGAAPGYPAGYYYSRRLVDSSGLAGSSLFVPAYLFIVAAMVASGFLATAFSGGTTLLGLSLLGSVGFWILGATARGLLTD